MYHLQRYAAAMVILEPLYRNIEPIDEVRGFFNWSFHTPGPCMRMILELGLGVTPSCSLGANNLCVRRQLHYGCAF
jgi:hypothetical protein